MAEHPQFLTFALEDLGNNFCGIVQSVHILVGAYERPRRIEDMIYLHTQVTYDSQFGTWENVGGIMYVC